LRMVSKASQPSLSQPIHKLNPSPVQAEIRERDRFLQSRSRLSYQDFVPRSRDAETNCREDTQP
jgi:hypothetical protein